MLDFTMTEIKHPDNTENPFARLSKNNNGVINPSAIDIPRSKEETKDTPIAFRTFMYMKYLSE